MGSDSVKTPPDRVQTPPDCTNRPRFARRFTTRESFAAFPGRGTSVEFSVGGVRPLKIGPSSFTIEFD
jgi:hypothetical protein